MWLRASRNPRGRRARLLDERGSVLLEFALLGLSFCLLLLGAIDIGRYQITMQSLRLVAATASRIALTAVASNASNACAAVPSSSSLQSSTIAANPAPMLASGLLSVSASCAAADANGVNEVTVTATYPFKFIAPILASSTKTLTASTGMAF